MNQFELDFAWEKLNTTLQYAMTESDFRIWKEQFMLIDIASGNNMAIGYKDEGAYHHITENYINEIYTAAYNVCGGLVTIKFKHVNEKVKKVKDPKNADPNGEKPAKEKKTKKRKTRRGFKLWTNILLAGVCFVLAVVLLVVGVNFVNNLNFREEFYTVTSTKIHDNIRIIQISDLHGTEFGAGNQKLLNRLKKLDPDLIVLTGDILDENGNVEQVTALCKKIAAIAPTYYVLGNHEVARSLDVLLTKTALDEKFGFDDQNRSPEKLISVFESLRATLEATGVKVLLNESDSVTIGSDCVVVFGTLTSNPSAFWPYAGENYSKYTDENTNRFKLFLSHEPYLYETFDDEIYGDLALCGHTHGGVVDLPVVGSLYDSEWGLLPEMRGYQVSGKRVLEKGATLIISRGLTNKGMIRIGNQPQLVVIDITRY